MTKKLRIKCLILDSEAGFAVDALKTLRFGLGAMQTAEYQIIIFKNIIYKTRFGVFIDYLRYPNCRKM